MRRPPCARRALLAWAAPALLCLGAPNMAAAATAPACANGTTVTIAGAPAAPTLCGLQTPVTPAGASAPVPVNAYLGIQYATAARFQPPAATVPAGSNVAQTAAGPFCPQAARPNLPTSAQSENCLYLNVFTPQSAIGAQPQRPVLFFIHGGAFVEGSGYLPLYDSAKGATVGNLYDGSYLAAAGDMVVVTINYRLGALGFLALDNAVENPAVGGPLRGNFGILDQQAALDWVQKYIGAFGGDATRVTVAGESAGAMSAGLHLFSAPDSATRFQAAIMESNPVGSVYRTPAQAQGIGSLFRDALCTQVGGCLAGKPILLKATPAQIVAAQAGQLFGTRGKAGNPKALAAAEREAATRPLVGLLAQASPQVNDGLPWSPTVDGKVIVGQPLAGYNAVSATASMPPKPFVFGVNRDEGAVFANLAFLKLGVGLNSLVFNEGLVPKVWPDDAKTILGYSTTVQGQPVFPYRAPTRPAPSYMNGTAATLSGVINDFAFRCGNLAMANRAAARNAQASPALPAFGYLFAQPPLIDLYSAGKPPTEVAACAPGKNGNVCHGNELPYVFNTLGTAYAVYTRGSQPPPPADQALAQTMAAAWASFVNSPASPAPWTPVAASGAQLPTAWTPYAGLSSSLSQWSTAGSPSSLPASSIDSAAHCTALWNTVAPIGGQ